MKERSKPIRPERKPEVEKKHIKKDGRIQKPKGTVYKKTVEDACYDGFWSKEVGS